MRSVVAAATFLLALQPWSPSLATSTCVSAYGACMGRCIELAGIRQTQPERCMLTCVQGRTRCAAPARSVQAEPAIPLPQPAPAAAKQPAPPPTAKHAELVPDSNGEPAATFRWDGQKTSTRSLFKFTPIPRSSAAPDIPLH
jgi:hypothetical protein